MPLTLQVLQEAVVNRLGPAFGDILENDVFLKEFAQQVMAANGDSAIQWLKRPENLKTVAASGSTALIVLILLSCAGFGAVGIVAGSPAAIFQGAVFGGATPAAGVFATLQSMGMTGTYGYLAGTVSAVMATAAGTVTRAMGRS